MIDLHTHTFFSDGELAPSELVRRAEEKGLSHIGLADHGDMSNIDFIVPRLVKVADALNQVLTQITVIPAIEITHVPPALIADCAAQARDCGARIVVVHGETIVEPVAPGTNRAAIEAGVDILAHPGLISDEDAQRAAERGVFLEISCRGGHSFTNGHVARAAERTGARLVVNTDSHSPRDLMDAAMASQVVSGCGLPETAFQQLQENALDLLARRK
ncbi:MAG: PHP domain-containing protein [Deltaproteobacteria bacterium]|nr:MAG: PHP domain-containing protein [Deltaproteobacteria bacterium]